MRRAPLLLLALPLLAACGAGAAGPQLGHADAAGLISLSHRIASEGACAQARDIPKLHARAIALVNAHRIPPTLQEPLLSGVNALAAEQPVCLPTVAASSPSPVVTAPAPHPHGPPPEHGGHGPGPGHGHGHGHDHGDGG